VLLAWCMQQGVVIYPSVPNTTHVTQEMDQVYGGFKTDYRKSLQELLRQKMDLWTPTSTTTSTAKSFTGQVKLSADHFGKMIFGTHADDHEQLELPNLWSKHFSQQNLLEMWAKVGVVPLTRACLSDKQVQRVILGEPRKQAAAEADKLGDATDESVDLLAESVEAADESVDLLAESVEAPDASVDLLASSESCEPLDLEEEWHNYSATTNSSGSNSSDLWHNDTVSGSGSNTIDSSIETPVAANLAYLKSYRDLSLEELETKNHKVCRLLTSMGLDGRHLKLTWQGSRRLRGRRHPRRLLTIKSSTSSCRKQVPRGKPSPSPGGST
jgi:hypothetical protein